MLAGGFFFVITARSDVGLFFSRVVARQCYLSKRKIGFGNRILGWGKKREGTRLKALLSNLQGLGLRRSNIVLDCS